MSECTLANFLKCFQSGSFWNEKKTLTWTLIRADSCSLLLCIVATFLWLQILTGFPGLLSIALLSLQKLQISLTWHVSLISFYFFKLSNCKYYCPWGRLELLVLNLVHPYLLQPCIGTNTELKFILQGLYCLIGLRGEGTRKGASSPHKFSSVLFFLFSSICFLLLSSGGWRQKCLMLWGSRENASSAWQMLFLPPEKGRWPWLWVCETFQGSVATVHLIAPHGWPRFYIAAVPDISPGDKTFPWALGMQLHAWSRR